jgi:rhodanese-related sulfurtransferase
MMPFDISPSWIAVGLVVALWLALTRLGKITGERARALVNDGAKLIDVRTEAEFKGGHIQGAENIPLDRVRSHASALVDGGHPLVVYCASGMRSASAKRILRASGVREVHDLGAMSRW